MSAATPSTSWSETIGDGEAARFDALAAILRDLQRAQAAKTGKGRALHYKRHVAFLAEVETRDDAPAWAKQGIFAAAGKYAAYVRFSNGAGRSQRDKTPDVRGIALKIVGVPGKKLIPGMEDAATQDVLAILGDAVPFRTPEAFVGVVRAASGSPLLALPRLVGALGLGFASILKKAQAGISRPIDSLAKQTYFSALPIRWGEYAVKLSLAPLAAPEPSVPVDGAAPDRLGLDLAARAKAGALRFELRVQPFIDEARTPIEDPTRSWSEADSPWTTVATLTILEQDVESARGRRVTEYVERLSFDPWHAPVDFRPLGALMRARSAAYRESTIERGASPEPTGDETWD